MTLLNMFKETLHICVKAREPNFSGVGVLVCSTIDDLPVIGMRKQWPKLTVYSAGEQLAYVSTASSNYHDGFHMLSLDCEVTHFSQYFSPPIVPCIQLPDNDRFGGRYVAALYGSALNGVEFSGIVSASLELSIFKNGKTVLSEKLE